MRTLTILRRKAIAGCAATMKVYIEDPQTCDLKINGVSCRKLGNLKNNQQVQFMIGQEAARIFVVADKFSKNFSSEFYFIPEGTEDVFLSGKNHYNPFAGNPFYFDQVTGEEILVNRKKSKRKMAWLLVAAALVGGVVGYITTSDLFNSDNPKTFSDSGLQITLTDSFRKVKVDGYDVCFENRDAAVLCLKEPFTLMEGLEDYSLQDYGELVISNNKFDHSVTLQKDNDRTYFTFTSNVDGDVYYYYAVVFKSTDAFWLLQFSTLEEKADEYRDLFVQWGNSVTFES